MHGVRDHAVDIPGHVLFIRLSRYSEGDELIARPIVLHLVLQPGAKRRQIHARRVVADAQLLTVVNCLVIAHRHLQRRLGHAMLRQNEWLALMGRPPGHHARQHIDLTIGKPGVVLRNAALDIDHLHPCISGNHLQKIVEHALVGAVGILRHQVGIIDVSHADDRPLRQRTAAQQHQCEAERAEQPAPSRQPFPHRISLTITIQNPAHPNDVPLSCKSPASIIHYLRPTWQAKYRKQ